MTLWKNPIRLGHIHKCIVPQTKIWEIWGFGAFDVKMIISSGCSLIGLYLTSATVVNIRWVCWKQVSWLSTMALFPDDWTGEYQILFSQADRRKKCRQSMVKAEKYTSTASEAINHWTMVAERASSAIVNSSSLVPLAVPVQSTLSLWTHSHKSSNNRFKFPHSYFLYLHLVQKRNCVRLWEDVED